MASPKLGQFCDWAPNRDRAAKILFLVVRRGRGSGAQITPAGGASCTRVALVFSPGEPSALSATDEQIIAAHLNHSVFGFDQVPFRADASRESNARETLLEFKVRWIAAPGSDAIFPGECVDEPCLPGHGPNEDLVVNLGGFAFLASKKDAPIAEAIDGAHVEPASGLWMDGDARAEDVFGQGCGICRLVRTITYHPPPMIFRVAVLVAVWFGLGCLAVRRGATHDFLLNSSFCVV